MTTDAKVGLLLGLVFIVIIAFVINGLPDFVKTLNDKTVVETAVTTQTGGNLVIEPAVVDVARSLQQGHSNLRYVEASSQTTALDTYAGSSQATEAVATEDSSQSPSDAIASENTTSQSGFSNTVSSVQENPTLILPQVQQEQQAAQQRMQLNPQLNQTRQAAQDTVSQIEPPVTSQPAKTAVIQQAVAGKSHVVGKGESLGSIAKKYYGSEVGNQRSTIQMLYEANKSVLDSPNKVNIGDKLVIPKVAAAQDKPAESAVSKEAPTPRTDTLLDKFKGVFVSAEKKDEVVVDNSTVEEKPKEKVSDKSDKKVTVPPVKNKTVTAAATMKDAIQSDDKPKVAEKQDEKDAVVPVKNKTATMIATMDYTIQNGDNPYKIAEKFLGDGDRYPEIIALNKGKLANPSRLVVGTKIKVPKR